MPIDSSTLAQFTGTEKWTRWSALFPKMVLTEGAKYVAENAGAAGAYWLMDAIASYQPELQKKDALRNAQFWELTVRPDKSAVLECLEDVGIPPAITQNIDYTDFDLPKIRLYCMPADGNGIYTILLPSEY